MDPQGKWLEDCDEVAEVAVKYFNDIFPSGLCT